MIHRKTIFIQCLIICALLLALTGCTPEPGQIMNQLVQAVNAQKTDVALRLFSDEAVVVVDGESPISGSQEIRAWLDTLIAENVILSESEMLEEAEDSFSALYTLETTRATNLGIDSLDGTAEITTRMGRISKLKFALSDTSRLALQQAELRQGAPLLSYVVITSPQFLQASPVGYNNDPNNTYPNMASLTVMITNDTSSPVQVRKISFHIPQGRGAGDLTPNITGINSERSDHWHVDDNNNIYELTPETEKDGLLEESQGIWVTLSDVVINDQPGVWGLTVTEETGQSAIGRVVIQSVKAPFALYVSDLFADQLVIEAGESITLSWAGSGGATYQLFNGQEFIDVTRTDNMTIDNLQQTTTFYLTATLDGAYQPEVIRELTVTVLQP